jgi:hypothetical protein
MTEQQRAVSDARANVIECGKLWEAARTPEFERVWSRQEELSAKKRRRGGLTAKEAQEWWDIWNDSKELGIFMERQEAVEAALAKLEAAEKALTEKESADSSSGATGLTPARPPAAPPASSCQPSLTFCHGAGSSPTSSPNSVVGNNANTFKQPRDEARVVPPAATAPAPAQERRPPDEGRAAPPAAVAPAADQERLPPDEGRAAPSAAAAPAADQGRPRDKPLAARFPAWLRDAFRRDAHLKQE